MGFGLNSNQFDDHSMVSFTGNKLSRRIFRQQKKELLDTRFIVQIETKNRRDKFYSITPLGIVYLFQEEPDAGDEISKKSLKQMEIIFLCFINFAKFKSNFFKFDSIQVTDTFELLQYMEDMKEAMPVLLEHNVRISEDKRNIELFLGIINENIQFKFASFSLRRGIDGLELKQFRKLYENRLSLEEMEFHSYLASFLMFAIIHQILYWDYENYVKYKESRLTDIEFLDLSVIQKVIEFNSYFIEQTKIANNNMKGFEKKLKQLKIKT